jgi:carbonic anhydrase/acetyltransferase-like protein (isoleucine patch superfamily)
VLSAANIHATQKPYTVIGDHVLVGPHAYLVGCVIGDCAFLATGAATAFHGANISARAEVRIYGTVHVQTRLPPDAEMPIGWVAVGDPAHILPPDRHDEIWKILGPLNFPDVAYGIDRPASGGRDLRGITRTVTRELRQRHERDVVRMS